MPHRGPVATPCASPPLPITRPGGEAFPFSLALVSILSFVEVIEKMESIQHYHTIRGAPLTFAP